MLKKSIIAITLSASLSLTAISFDEKEPVYDLATIEFKAFDQTPGAGWRYFSERGHYLKAAKMIDEFLKTNPAAKKKNTVLQFHAGQMYASAGKYDLAIKRFQNSFTPETAPKDMKMFNDQWDLYVGGTIAFLKGDKKDLTDKYNQLMNGHKNFIQEANGKVLKMLLDNLDKTYAEIFMKD